MLKKLYIAMFGLMAATTVSAQSNPQEEIKAEEIEYLHRYNFWDNWYVQGGIGISHSMSENTRFGNFFEAQRPSFTVGIGKWFWPSFGLRMTAGYKPQKGRAEWSLCDRFPDIYGFYKFTVLAAYLDGMVNFTNVFYRYSETRRFNLIGFIGVGYNRSVNFEKKKLEDWGHEYPVDPTPHNYLAAHVGLNASYMLSEPWDINFEVSFNGTDDAYNGVRYDRVYDTYVDVLVGFTYHFKDQFDHHRFKYTHATDSPYLEHLNDDINKERERLAKAEAPITKTVEDVNFHEQLNTTVSFYIDRHYITDAQKKNVESVCRWMENHPDMKLIVTGYADVQTAYPAYNMALSKRRAQAVYDMMVNEFGVDPSRLRIDFKGDVEQPYGLVNEWNRAVIFIIDK